MTRTREILAPTTILQNRYRVLRELGHGGMGTVYEALDQRINCLVALKETSAGNQNEARRAFEREASLLGNLRHSGLPKVMDYFSEGDADFLIMEFIPGDDLAHLLESRHSPLPQDQVLLWADEMLKVLEYLHGQEPPILHRDIKPANLKVTRQGEIFLLDFGLAKGSAGQMQTLATSRSVYGYTPVYASLEQILGQGTDPRSDLYSVGATLYHLLTAVIPADAPKRFSLIQDEQPDPLQPIEKLNPECTSSVAAIIHQAMAINRRQRPVGAAEMRKALRQAAERDQLSVAEAQAAADRKRRQFAGTAKLDEGFQEEIERQRREEEDARRVEAQRQTEAERQAEARRQVEAQRLAEAARQAAAQRLAEAERRLELEEAQRAEEAQRQAEAVKRAAQERLRANEEARRLADEERQHVEAERQRIEGQRRREREAADAERQRIAARRQHADQTLAETTAPSSTLTSVDKQQTVEVHELVAKPAVRNRSTVLISVVVLAVVAIAGAVVWLHPWRGQEAGVVDNSNRGAEPVDNSNRAAAPVDNSNNAVPAGGNLNKAAAPSRAAVTPPANSLPENTPAKNTARTENANRPNTTNNNLRRSAQASSTPPVKKRVDADAAERRRRARSILDRPY